MNYIRTHVARVAMTCIAAKMEEHAHSLAAAIDGLGGLTAEQRCDLRRHPMQMLEMAELLREVPEVRQPAPSAQVIEFPHRPWRGGGDAA